MLHDLPLGARADDRAFNQMHDGRTPAAALYEVAFFALTVVLGFLHLRCYGRLQNGRAAVERQDALSI